ncbi:metallophosphoesterase [Streptomyces sp. NPDC059708]|uniref:metallophosphoesterase n=1 Tax=Streptomyces sp. NPDC059708 TaxID=3346916 RepID=UPI0036A36C8A
MSDTQMPYEDNRAMRNVINFIGDYQPDAVVQIGDLVDYPEPSRWNAGTKSEFQTNVLKDSDYAKRKFLAPLRDVYDGPVGVLEGNHDLRPRTYLAKNAPALADAKFFDLDQLLDFDGFGVELLPAYYDIAPGWVAVHGHETKGMSQIPGRTALSKALKAGTSLVMGHTHKLAVCPHSTGYDGRFKVTYGFEVGHLMDARKASYLKGGPANWQRGFGLLLAGRFDATPVPVPVDADGSFVVDGTRYGALVRSATGRFTSKRATCRAVG